MKISIQSFLIGILVLFASKVINAQDPHFTQFFDAPVYLNPAFTGNIEGSYRFMAIYRNQWPGVSDATAFSTPFASFDINLGGGTGNNSFGLGLSAYNDQSGGGVFNNTAAMLSLAYHLGLDRNNKHYLSAGFQGGINNKKLDATKVTFSDQYNGQEIDPTIMTSDAVTSNSLVNVDLNAGVTWSSFFSSKSNLKLGAAYFHLIPAKESFFGGDNELPSRIAVHANGAFGLGNKLSFNPHVLYMTQATASELVAGGSIGYNVNRDVGVSLGGGTRIGDAFYGLIGFEAKGLKIGFGFDLNTSAIKQTASGIGAYEVSLSYSGSGFSKDEPITPAIRFY